jgi:hypothetical protein
MARRYPRAELVPDGARSPASRTTSPAVAVTR